MRFRARGAGAREDSGHRADLADGEAGLVFSASARGRGRRRQARLRPVRWCRLSAIAALHLFGVGLEPGLALVAILVTAAAALLQATLGVGFAMLSVPVLAFVDPRLAPEPQLFLIFVLTVSMAIRERHAMIPSRVGWVIAGRLPGTALGLLLLSRASPRFLEGIVGGLVLAMAGLLASRLRLPRSRAVDLGIGMFSSLSGTIAAIGGPPLTLIFRDASGPVVRANLALVFAAGVSMALFGRVLSGHIGAAHLVIALYMLPGLALGFWASRYTVGRVEGPRLRGGLVAVAALAGAGVLARAISFGGP